MNSERFKKFTILHSNDMHGDFLAEEKGAEGKVIGGMALLSGYINKVRQAEKNVLFVISGDMLQGSIIDAESRGLSTIEIMNYLAPDVVSIGNHEMDYGLPHLLFLEKLANFPLINANLYITKYNKRLMKPYVILNIDGFDIMFIGIVNEEAFKTLRRDQSIGEFVSLTDAAQEVGKICNAYKNEDIDLTVLLTHIGFEEDKKLAAILDPAWGVDLILGGHSHTFLEQPAQVNNILIAQAGVGTDQVGRFDVVVDDDTNSIVEWKWQLIPVDNDLAEPDPELEHLISMFKEQVDRKYNRLICRFAHKLTNPTREEETELGNLMADMIAHHDQLDIVFLASGSLRTTELGPLVTLRDLKEFYPFDDTFYKFKVTGSVLVKMFTHFMRSENRIPGESEYFQVNKGIHAVYNDRESKLESLIIHGEPLEFDRYYTISMDGYRLQNCLACFGITSAELAELAEPKVIITSSQDVVQEYFSEHQNLNSHVENRLVYI